MRRRRVAAVPDAPDASTRAFTLQRQPDENRSRPLRSPPDVVSVYRTNLTQWTQCVHGQPDANRSRTVRASGKMVSVYTALLANSLVHRLSHSLIQFNTQSKYKLLSKYLSATTHEQNRALRQRHTNHTFGMEIHTTVDEAMNQRLIGSSSSIIARNTAYQALRSLSNVCMCMLAPILVFSFFSLPQAH